MLTDEEIKKCYNEKIAVVIHAPDNPNSQCARRPGFICHVYPNSTNPDQLARQTYQETMVRVIFPDGDEIHAWAHEFRIANLRNPLVMQRNFIHSSSTKYSGNDMSHEVKKGK